MSQNEPTPLRIAVLLGSTRPGRRGAEIARWVHAAAAGRPAARYEVVDLLDHPLPFLDEELPPILGAYALPHTQSWAGTIAQYDAFVVVTPEYNHSVPAVLKNAIDFLYAEWNDKVAGVVAYGAESGTRAVEQLRLVFGELQVAVVRQHVPISLYDDFEDFERLAPRPRTAEYLDTLFEQVEAWGGALREVRAARAREGAGDAVA